MKVEQIQPKSNKLKDLREYIAELSSVVRDKSPKSAEKLFSRLLSESTPYKGGIISHEEYKRKEDEKRT